MPINLTAHDTRLEGHTPLSTSTCICIDVSEDTPIQDFFEQAISIANSHNGIGTLTIMAHGVRFTMNTETQDDDSSGIQFCNPPVSYQNIHLFGQLRDKVDRIVLHVCHAAEDSMTAHGEGDELCRQMAMQAHAEVTAARENQIYRSPTNGRIFVEEGPIEFGEWEGTVVVYGRDGNLIAEYNNPSSWRDSDGVLHDPRIDPEPPSTSRHGDRGRHVTAGRGSRR